MSERRRPRERPRKVAWSNPKKYNHQLCGMVVLVEKDTVMAKGIHVSNQEGAEGIVGREVELV